ncbi:hypothetical protein J31TS4_16780 [Paenibacillus sp. J31TS4]|uniref:VOC family protein n=1 Tax=Paenibacillus sp. J31TS4 TaxID=2807195 RepID=UPI001B0C7EE5|nr:VOC family protein [Paenibacillus sp. J31TS4]GIP38398.1 hypothetical protein J31TS4_16780 [Paenibacillus sp. J31TS4]
METARNGVILFTQEYERALAFYRDVMGLQVERQKPGLTLFDFGGAYLMVEEGGKASVHEKTREQNPTVLRWNVRDFDRAVEELRSRGAAVTVRAFHWGTIGVLTDPEGNRLELLKHEEPAQG